MNRANKTGLRLENSAKQKQKEKKRKTFQLPQIHLYPLFLVALCYGSTETSLAEDRLCLKKDFTWIE